MSYEDGMAAINLEKPKKIPRTEYSAHTHWDLVNSVTGLNVSQGDSPANKAAAGKEFCKAWNYGYFWNVLIGPPELGGMRTKMGHAEYAAEGSDYNNEVTCPFKTPEDVLAFNPFDAYGKKSKEELTQRFEEHYIGAAEFTPDAVNVTGIYITCISGLIEMFGWDMMLTAMGLDSERFGRITNQYARWIQQYFDALAETDVAVVNIHDDIVWTSGPFANPEWYKRYVFPNYKNYFAPLLDAGKKIIYTSDGNYTMFVDDIVKTGVHGFVMEPTTDMAYIAEKYGRSHVLIGNADTRILLSGTKPEIRCEVERCIGIGKDCPGFFMAVGNHIPVNTPVENALYYNEVYEELSRR